MSFETVYNVDMTCESCVDSVKKALGEVPGLERFDIDLNKKLVSVTGIAAPSTIIQAIQDTGREAIIRGTGKPNSAAVAILETFRGEAEPVKGLARMVSIGDNKLLVDITLSGLPTGTYKPSFRASGNISKGALTTGDSLFKFEDVKVDQTGSGQSFQSAPMNVADLIGRSFVVVEEKQELKDALAGVIARSAGVWENDKQVCSCSGKTVWQERQDAHAHGLKV
ncbi:copper chaperone CCS1 [Cyberlindnera jadinii NRRL Y-1542]|uniref:Superoxide dismutase 1 copper chaperone n=2 Tax=Cyberlindnera jadinii (strain ATCC 18201 / CBS 1600 / BCRC 20928 / JCM 3617 / NBRC 0987 / NRRL Y-1542) TaxID=983966 RepID=A0A1E4RZM3_CYBJN|nr:Cu,Zn superoxide dismutase-like protein [Cyberlindnera jadinii NRRL Y-1542]ODV72692.1 Cu,Zn superoxide dismutase-like protein [Cyberlindnera jadinii NRRL Y-1542]